jgi:hypothetical protein
VRLPVPLPAVTNSNHNRPPCDLCLGPCALCHIKTASKVVAPLAVLSNK